jgi:hypothetical protein
MCEGVIMGFHIPDEVRHNDLNVIMHTDSDSTATFYFLAEPDDEVTVDPTFYIDDNVSVIQDSDTTAIRPGQYPYDAVPGTLTVGDEEL